MVCLKQFLAGALICIFTLAAWSQSTEPLGTEVALQLGSDRLAGSLTTENKVRTGGIEINLWSHHGETHHPALGGMSGYFSVGLENLGKATAANSDFPFTPNEGLTMGRANFSVFPCFLSNYWARLCLGVGYGVITVTQADNMQNYGTFVWSLNLQHHFANHVTVGLGTEWDQVQMIVNGRDSFFENWNSFLSAGYIF